MKSAPRVRLLVAPALLFLFFAVVDSETDSCSITLKQLSERPPLLLRPGGPLNVTGFAVPDTKGVVLLHPNSSLTLSCPGARNQLLHANHSTGYRQVNVTCASGTLNVRGVGAVDARELSCAVHAERTAERDRGQRCGANARGLRMRIGFRLQHGFLELITACFDDQLLTPIYANYTLVHSIKGKRPGGERAEFRTGGVFDNVSPRRQYEEQNTTLSFLLGDSQNFTSNDTLTRGHLASRAGFVFWPQKRATFFYVNAAPQWKSVNAGAWAGVERAVRGLAAARGDLQVVTGVYGVATLPNAQGRPTQLFLFADGAQRKMPVPALYWKVVFDPRTLEAIAFVGSNNPFEPLDSHPDLLLCTDLCSRIHWLPAVVTEGNYVYCCEVDALRQRVVDMPPLDVLGPLKNPFPSRKAKKRAMEWRNKTSKEQVEERRETNEVASSTPRSAWLALQEAELAFARQKDSERAQGDEPVHGAFM